jgi:hypothetical protein
LVNDGARIAVVNVRQTTTTVTAWTALTLSGTWAALGSGFHTPARRRVGDRVELRGLLTAGAPPSLVGNLPTGFRPTASLLFAQMANNLVARITIHSNGDINADAPSSAVYTSLDGISFSVSA